MCVLPSDIASSRRIHSLTLAFAMPPSAKISWHGPTTQAAFDLALERILATDTELILLLAGSNRERFGIHFKKHLIEKKESVDLTEVLGALSISLKIQNRFRIVVFGPHPAACCKRSSSDDMAFEALHQLTASLRAVHFVITGEHAAARHIFDSAAWQIVASTWDEGSFRELLREEPWDL
ncbi:unnamed protein product [Tilletia controversa]|uniref:Uncharacterized protein n=2 Tax=Tilletia TaxID=13289 RepID=A0A9N8M853_9BASI|nr:unnamed protein product [Tilletia caries]CAD6929583.1 unnamed protein product [Tilletia controversa]CAD6933070.1 unnamed protein product [Tilletia laevis]CAD6932091.1 unnamed protein product [Tilletia controversa]CAD6939174.1 unnamed protein product [Tilletia caries]